MEALPLLVEEQAVDQSHQSGGDSEAGEEGAEGEEGGADQVAYRAHGQSPQGAEKDAGQATARKEKLTTTKVVLMERNRARMTWRATRRAQVTMILVFF